MQAQALAQDLRELLAARADDLRAFAQIAAAAAESRQLPDLSSVPTRVLLTGGGALAAVALALVPRGRRAVGEVVDTVLATALLIVLIAVLLSLPLGTLYISYKALIFMAASLAESYPAVAKLLPALTAFMT